MITIEVKPDIKVDLEDILNGVSKLETADLKKVHQEIGGLLQSRKPHHLEKLEEALLSKIQKPLLSPENQIKYDELREKRRNTALSDKEYRLFMRLLREMENNSVERLRCLVELSQLKGITLQELMADLNLPALNPANA